MTFIKYCSLYYILRETNVVIFMKLKKNKRKIILHEDYFRMYFLDMINYIKKDDSSKKRFTIERNGVKLFFDICMKKRFVSIYVPREDLPSNKTYDIFHVKLSHFTSTINKIFKYYKIETQEENIFKNKLIELKKRFGYKNIMTQRMKNFICFVNFNILYFIYATVYIIIVSKITNFIFKVLNLIFTYISNEVPLIK